MFHTEEYRTYRGTPRDILSDFQNRLSRKIRFRLKKIFVKIFVLRKIPKISQQRGNFYLPGSLQITAGHEVNPVNFAKTNVPSSMFE